MTCYSLLAWLLKVGIVHCSMEGRRLFVQIKVHEVGRQ
jgi:hypothetical protein